MLGRLHRFFSPLTVKYSTLAGHLIAKINSDYLNASLTTKWIDWIGSAGIKRANDYVAWLKSDDVKGMSDYDLTAMILNSMNGKKMDIGVSFEDSKNLRLIVARETFRYLNDKESPEVCAQNKRDYGMKYASRMMGTHKLPGHAEHVELTELVAMVNKLHTGKCAPLQHVASIKC